MVYVDELFFWPIENTAPAARAVAARNRGQWCHMHADSEDELHAFATRIGLRRSWAQHAGTPRVHYDLTPGKRKQALANGAVFVPAASNTSTTAQPLNIHDVLAAGRGLRESVLESNVRMNAALARMRCEECGHSPKLDTESGCGSTIYVCRHLYEAIKNACTDSLEVVRHGSVPPLGALRIVPLHGLTPASGLGKEDGRDERD